MKQIQMSVHDCKEIRVKVMFAQVLLFLQLLLFVYFISSVQSHNTHFDPSGIFHASEHEHGVRCAHNKLSEFVEHDVQALNYVNHEDVMNRLKQLELVRQQEEQFENIRISFVGIYKDDIGKGCYTPGEVVTVTTNSNNIAAGECSSSQNFNCSYTCREADLITEERILTLEGQIIPNVHSLFSSMLLTRRLSYDIETPSMCLDFPIPVSTINSTTTDLLIIVSMRPAIGILGYATACGFEQKYGRPVLGLLNINPSYLGDPSSVLITAVHEFVHVLGFSSSLYGNFVDENGLKRGIDNVLKKEERMFVDSQGFTQVKTVSKLITPHLTEAVRTHFNCPTADGAELEEYGSVSSVGSHFESRVFMNEIMTSSNAFELFTPVAVFSQFSRALLLDSGWYRIESNYSGASLLYGAKTGCAILDQRCESWNLQAQGFEGYFCDAIRNADSGAVINRCTFDLANIGFCGIVNHGDSLGYYEHLANATQGGIGVYDFCPLVARYSDGACNPGLLSSVPGSNGQTYGPQSACFNSNVGLSSDSRRDQDARCYQYSCDNGRLAIVIANSTRLDCPIDQSFARISEGLPEGYEGYVECPRDGYNILCLNTKGRSNALIRQPVGPDASNTPLSSQQVGDRSNNNGLPLPQETSAASPMLHLRHHLMLTYCVLVVLIATFFS